MNIKNLYENQIIKNYKELCSILEIKETTGGARQKQLKELSTYCRYEKNGNKYIILEIYKSPIIALSDLKQTKYIKQLSNIIIEYLYNNNNNIQIPLFKLLTVLGIANSNYEVVNSYRKEFSQINNIQLASIYYFYSNTKMEFKRIVERCLNNLRSRRVLNWSICTMVIDTENKTIYKADKETEELIIDTEKMALEELEKPNMFELMKDKKAIKEFNKLVKAETGGLNYYYAYDLTIGNIALKIEYNNIQQEKQELNNIIINKVNNTFNKERYKPFEADYNILIDSLIKLNNDDPLLRDKLKSQRIENINKRTKAKNDYIESIDQYNNKDIIESLEEIEINTY